MERVISSIVSFPSSQSLSPVEYNKELRALHDVLSKTHPSTLAGVSKDNDPLHILNNEQHSLGVLFILNARVGADQQFVTNLWPRIVEFFEEFDGRQLRPAMIQDQFKRLISTVGMVCSNMNKPILAVKLLKNALIRLNYPNPPHTFSTIHTAFVKNCVEAKCFRDAIPILNVNIEVFPNHKEYGITYSDHLQYHFFGAIIYIGVKNWTRAAEFLNFVITCPGTAASTIQVEAMKKSMFVNLMIAGKTLPLPRTTPTQVARAYKALLKPYEAFVHAYNTRNPNVLRQEISLVADVFLQDGNWGLACQCLQHFRTHGIADLTHTYSTLSIDHILGRDLSVEPSEQHEKLDSLDMENYVLGMIESKDIRASLSHINNQQHGGVSSNSVCMVSFHDLPPPEHQNLADLEAQIQRIVKITNQSRLMDRKLGSSKEWITFLGRKSRTQDAEQMSSIFRDQGTGELEDTSQDYSVSYGGMDTFDDDSMRADIEDM